MKREVLKSYFEKTCSAADTVMVEEWLLDAQHQAEFEAFLEAYWAEHTGEAVQQPVAPQKRTLLYYMPRIAAAAAVVAGIVFSVHYFSGNNGVVEQPPATAIAVVKPRQLPADHTADTLRLPKKGAEVRKTKTKQYARKNSPQPEVAFVSIPQSIPDTAARSVVTKQAVKMSGFTKIMFNDSVFCKLSQAQQLAVINKMALRVDFSKASFSDLVADFRDRYGIVLELCAGTNPDKIAKAYTASFARITLPELINDMSDQMAFSYTLSNNVIKVCFN